MARVSGRVLFGFTHSVPACVLAVLLPLGCSDLGTQTDPHDGRSDGEYRLLRPLTAVEQAVISADNTFGFKLFAALNQSTAGKNIFVSPFSVAMALGMTLNGARGSTEAAMRNTLECSGMTAADINASYRSLMALLTGGDPKVAMEIGNSIWHRPDLNIEADFVSVNKTYFHALVTGLDFASPLAAPTINGWVDASTHGRIRSIVPDPIPRGMVMYLINAISFKGIWKYQFNPAATRDHPFRRADGTTVTCTMMGQGGKFAALSQANTVIVDLPYGDAGFSMTVVLPPSDVDLEAFVAGLSQAQWKSWVGMLAEQEVEVFMPKFQQEYTAELIPALRGLGMGVAFTPAAADFSGIDRRGGLYISEVIHKSFITVDEEGTEAAAVTEVGMERTSLGGGPLVLLLDRPFFYVIRERSSGAILFMGKMAAP